MKAAFSKNIHKMFQGLLNLWFMSEKVQIEDFLKKESQDLKRKCLRTV